MRYALDTENNRTLTLQDLWRTRADLVVACGPDLQKVRKILNQNIVCPECGNPVHVQGVNRVTGFVLAGRNLTQPHAIIGAGFAHYTMGSARNKNPDQLQRCRLYAPEDPRFQDLKPSIKDKALAGRIHELLLYPEIKNLNKAVLAKLHFVLTGRSITDKDRLHYDRVRKNYCADYEVLLSHPYVLPYAVISMAGEQWRVEDGKTCKARFMQQDSQELLYQDSEGKERIARVPMALVLQTSETGGRHWQRSQTCKEPFRIDELSARQLAGITDSVGLQTTLISMPRQAKPAEKTGPKPLTLKDMQGILPGVRWYLNLRHDLS